MVMEIRKLLGELEAHCPICNNLLTRDEDGAVTCEHCTNKARETDDYSLLVDFYLKVDVEVWILDKKKIDLKDGGSME